MLCCSVAVAGQKAYVTNITNNTVSIIDIANGNTITTIGSGSDFSGPFGIAMTPISPKKLLVEDVRKYSPVKIQKGSM